MKYYVFLMDNIVREIIPEIDPVFPELPIDARYTPDFLAQCVIIDEAEGVEIGDIYDPETGEFHKPWEVEPTEPEA